MPKTADFIQKIDEVIDKTDEVMFQRRPVHQHRSNKTAQVIFTTRANLSRHEKDPAVDFRPLDNSRMACYLDTEFTSLFEPELLSIGLVTVDGRELYVELDLASDVGRDRVSRASAFVQFEHVLPQWGRVPNANVSAFEMGQRAAEWLIDLAVESQNPAGTIDVIFDYETDYTLLEQAIRDSGFGERIQGLLNPVNIGQLTESGDGRIAATKCYRELAATRNLRRHHALADALALRAAHVASMKGAV